MRKSVGVLLAAMLVGCATPKPTANDAVIYFILPGMTSDTGAYQPTYGGAPSVSLHDVGSRERKMVGILGPGQKLAYRVLPGRHEFMLASRMSTDFMEANVAGGKTYYVVLQQQQGLTYDQRYGFRPVRPEDFENGLFRRWDTNLSFVERPEAWQRWSEGNSQSIDSRLREHRPAWDKQGADERRLRTLRVADGR